MSLLLPPQPQPQSYGWRFENTLLTLPATLFQRSRPTPVATPKVVSFNYELAKELGLDAQKLASPNMAPYFAGNELFLGSEPVALAYAGHQYGNFVVLGDGRAHLLGEHLTPDGRRVDIQLKGSGQSRFSRRGDGRAVLGPMLREMLISEAMHHLGIPTTRSLAVVTTGELVRRGDALPGAVLTRVAASHIRVGTFELLAHQRDLPSLLALADYTIERHYPECGGGPARHRNLLSAVIARQARLVAQWQLVGFVHGVMNTDNVAVSGETIDYGPCAFMDQYDRHTVFSSIDRNGRYAYDQQPPVMLWNLARFAEGLLPLLSTDQTQAVEEAQTALKQFLPQFRSAWLVGMRAKLGVKNEEADDVGLINQFLELLEGRYDWTNSFRALSESLPEETREFLGVPTEEHLAPWRVRWEERRARQPLSRQESDALMRRTNPAVIPRNHEVARALRAAEVEGDMRVCEQLLAVLREPFRVDPERIEYMRPPRAHEVVTETFCGT